MSFVLWAVAIVSLFVAFAARKKVLELQEKLDRSRYEGSSKELEQEELKKGFEVLRKQVGLLASGASIDPLMVREGRLYRNTSAKDLESVVASAGAYVIDVRTAQEWATGHIPGAVHIPMDALESRLNEVKRDSSDMYLVCAGGGRSSAAAEFLSNRGYLNVFNVEGGMNSWRGEVARD